MEGFNKEKPNETVSKIKGYAVRLVPFLREQRGQPYKSTATFLAVPPVREKTNGEKELCSTSITFWQLHLLFSFSCIREVEANGDL